MTKGSRFAFALILFWLSFFGFYIAFHPGGIQMPGPDPKTGQGTTHPAGNVRDVITHVISSIASGNTSSSDNSTQGA